MKLNDQYDKPVLIGPATRVLLFTTEKSTSDWVIKALSSKASEHPGVVPVASGCELGLPGLYACGFYVSRTGMLREIGIEARRIAETIAAV